MATTHFTTCEIGSIGGLAAGGLARGLAARSITGLAADEYIQMHTNTRLNYFTFFAINP